MSRPIHRSRFMLLLPRMTLVARVTMVALVALVALVAAGCGEPADDRVPGPNMETGFDFDPVATVVIGSNGAEVDDVELRPGQTIKIVNEAGREIRFKGDKFDTGVMLDGESTVIAFVEVGEVELIQTLGGENSIRVAVVSEESEESEG